MSIFISKLLSSILQITIFSLFPFIYWIFNIKKKENFFHWIGIKSVLCNDAKTFFLIFSAIIFAFGLLSFGILYLLRDVNMATSEFSNLGIKGIPSAIIYAFFNTALPEEILFRGFLLKAISSKSGFMAGNIAQSFIFGFLHGMIFVSTVGIFKAVIIICFTGSIGFCMGYLNEKQCNGSLIPSWIVHGIANTFSSFIQLFGLI